MVFNVWYLLLVIFLISKKFFDEILAEIIHSKVLNPKIPYR